MSREGRIVHIIWDMTLGGAERALFQLVRQQRLSGLHADVIVCREAGLYGERVRGIGATVYEAGQKNTYDLSVRDRVREIVSGYSIAHLHSAEIGMMKIISGVEHLRRYYTHRSGVFRYPWKQLLRYKIAGYYLRKAFHGVSGNTRQGCQAASKLFGIPLEQIPATYNGIDFSLLDPQRSSIDVQNELGITDPSNIIRIGTSANLRGWKRIDRLIRSLEPLKEMPVHCYIIGDGPARTELEQLTGSLGLSNIVTFTGKKEHIGDYLQVLDVFVLPSGPEESFGNSAVEAMGVGLPTIVFSDGGGLVEHIGNGTTGYIVDDVQELSARLRELIIDEGLRRTIGAAAKESVRSMYDLNAMVQRYNAMYLTSFKF